jgi:uncharacterized protein
VFGVRFFKTKERKKAMAKRITESDAALLEAALEGSTEKVAAALKKQANVNAENHEGWTPLICAAINGDAETVLLLLEAGADINAEARDGSTA